MRQKTIPAVPERTVYEEIASVSISYLDQSATAGIVQGQMVQGEFVPDFKSVRYVDLGHEGYLELMQSKPSGKPQGEFRRADLFDVIDKRGNK
jgi:hypothetical protein